MIVYFSQITQSYAEAMLIFSIYNIIYALSKIPAGLFSDKVGRKPVILLGSLMLAVSFFILALSGQLNIKYLLFLFSVLWGMGEALISGTIDALMFETMEELNRPEDFRMVYSKSMISDQLGCAIGAATTMFMTYFFSIQYVAWLSVIPVTAQFFISTLFIEPKVRNSKSDLSTLKTFAVFKQFVKNKRLCFYAIMDIYFSTLGDISHRFESAYFKTFTADWVISMARVLKHLFGMLGFFVISQIKKFGSTSIYFSSIGCNVVVRTIALCFNNIFTPFISMFINFFYATAATAKSDILQHEFLPQYRASAQAIIFFIKGLYMSLIMYLLGIIADSRGILYAMSAMVMMRIIGLLLAYIWHKFENIQTLFKRNKDV